MSSNNWNEESFSYFDFNNLGGGKESFTDLHSCEIRDDTDSQVSYSNSLEIDDDDDDQAKNKNKKLISEKVPSSSNMILDLIREDLYKFVFMPISKQLSDYVRCRIIRQKFDLFETFHLEIEYEDDGRSFCLLTAERQFKIIGHTQHTISVIPKFSNDYYSAELQNTNFAGTSYVLYDLNGNERQQLAAILYESNFLGLSGPRKIEALIPKFDKHDKKKIDEDYLTEQGDSFIHLHNKLPSWNPHTCSYSLKFSGTNRVAMASVKNFQMVIEDEDHVEQIVMQFGRMSENIFSCDFRYPLSLIQAFGIALSAFESRLFRD